MLKKSISLLAGILILQLTYSCEQKTDSPDSLDALNATLWMQKSAEYKANCLQAYYLAGNQLQIAMDDKNWTAALEQHGDYTGLPPAIILDIDETVLDNSPYESRLIRNGENYSDKTWDQWCREANAEPVPGALEFCKKASEMGVTVFYITNRFEKLKEETRKNLKKIGFPLNDNMETIFPRLESSDKGGRREVIALDYRILLMIGDNLGDFASGFTHAPTNVRDSLFTEYKDYFGTKWISLPNPVYGDWESALIEYNYGLTDKQKEYIKKKALSTE